MKAELDTDLEHVTAQGEAARDINDDDTNNSVLPHDCPYGPGEKRDAWMRGAGFPVEEVRQVDTSEPTTDDVRREPERTVRQPAKGRSRGGKGRGGSKRGGSKAKTAVTTTTTGNAETSLVTKTGSAKPEQAATANVETVVGNPAGGEGDRTSVDPEKLM